MSKELINLSNLQRFLSKLNEKFALKKAMKGISEDSEGNIIIGEEGLVPTPNENSKGKFLRSDGEWALPSVYDSMTVEEGVAGVSKVDRVINAKNLKQIVNSDGFLTSLDSSKLTGIINIENLPQGALERILIVSSKEERLTLLDSEVQLGDVVKEADTGLMYYVINTEKLNSEEGYTQFTAGSASSVPWSGVTDKPLIPTKTSELTNDSDFAIDSGVVHKTGNETINGIKIFTDNIHKKNSALDLQVNPSSDQYNSFLFADKNNAVMGYLEHIQTTTGVNVMGLYARDKNNATHGFQVTSEDNVIPLGDGVVNLGLSGAKWKNVYATTFNGNLKGNADSSTKASYLDNYSLPGSNKIYLDWDTQVNDYVGLKVDNTNMGGLITTNNIGSQSVNSATYATSAASSTKATQDSAGQQINKTYIKELSVSGRTITYKRGDNTTGTITTQDTNTTYSKLSQFTNDSGYITSSGSCNYATTAGSAGNGIDSSGEGWIRFKNGIQICFGEGISGQNNSFPKAFKSGSVPHVNIMHYTNNNLPYCATGQQGTGGATTNATFNFLLWGSSSGTYVNYTGCHYIAIGYWK